MAGERVVNSVVSEFDKSDPDWVWNSGAGNFRVGGPPGPENMAKMTHKVGLVQQVSGME